MNPMDISAITNGPDGNLWFNEAGTNKIGRITTSGVVTEFDSGIPPLPQATDGPVLRGITAAPNGNIWFTVFRLAPPDSSGRPTRLPSTIGRLNVAATESPNQTYVAAVYQDVLGRVADASGESYRNSQLAAGKTLNQVAQGIAGSQENNSQLINDDYFHYLGRAADQGGLAYWLGQFADGKTNEDVIAGFTGSAEYYKEHTA